MADYLHFLQQLNLQKMNYQLNLCFVYLPLPYQQIVHKVIEYLKEYHHQMEMKNFFHHQQFLRELVLIQLLQCHFFVLIQIDQFLMFLVQLFQLLPPKIILKKNWFEFLFGYKKN